MARLTLNPNATMKSLGAEVLKAAHANHTGAGAEQQSAESAISSMFTEGENPNIVFHYDTQDTVNVVIPYVGDNAVKGDYFDDLASEAMGHIVVFGCGK